VQSPWLNSWKLTYNIIKNNHLYIREDQWVERDYQKRLEMNMPDVLRGFNVSYEFDDNGLNVKISNHSSQLIDVEMLAFMRHFNLVSSCQKSSN
jgi:competence CoiA-like predicted nuclease